MAPPARSTTPRQRHLPAPSLTLDELLEQSAWFSRLDAAAQLQVRANATERPVAAGQSLSHHGDPSGAVNALRTHLRVVLSDIERMNQEKPDLFSAD